MTWIAAEPTDAPTLRAVFAPLLMCARWSVWEPLLNGLIDEMSSDPRTLDVLSTLIAYTEPKIIVEVGTYRGIGTATFAETLAFHRMDGHIWTCDPADYQVDEMLTRAGLNDKVTLVRGTFEDVIPVLPGPMGFCYIDASSYVEAGMRLRYTRLALEHMAPGGVVAVDDAGADWRGARTLRRMADLYLPQSRGLAVLIK